MGLPRRYLKVKTPWPRLKRSTQISKRAHRGPAGLSWGLVGYFGYDVVRYVETKLEQHDQTDALNTPDILLLVAEEVLVFDNLAGTLTMVVTANAEEPDARSAALARLNALEQQACHSPAQCLSLSVFEGADLQSIEAAARHHTDREQFMGWVETIRKSILDGDVMQVVPSQRMTVDLRARPFRFIAR